MFYRCIIIVIITNSQVFANGDDTITAEWLAKEGKQDTEDDFNLDPKGFANITEERKQIKNYPKRENEGSINLDPRIEAVTTPPPATTVSVNVDKKEILNEAQTTDKTNLNPSSFEGPQDCITKDNQNGSCVLYYLCDPDYGTIIDDGSTIIDLRSKERSCPHYLEVCCLPSKVVTNNVSTKLDQATVEENIAPSYGTNTNASNCGWNNPALHVFQTKSNEFDNNKIYANYGDFPWMIALMKKRNATDEWSRNDYVGGGSLIHPAIVLTAAHKVYQLAATELKCRAGEWDTQTTFELFGHQERDVKKIVTHLEFFRTSVFNDIGLLFLQSEFELTNSPNIGIACVGTSLPSPGTECFSMGWGEDFKMKNKYAVILKKVRLPLVGAQDCTELLRKTRLGPFFKLHKSLTCAGGESGVDTCEGDGGSALVCPIQKLGESTQFAIFGMVAYGIACGEPNVPGVYVNVPYLKQWIDTTMAKEGYTSNVYRY